MALSILIICLFVESLSTAEASFEGCLEQVTFGYEYIQFHPIETLKPSDKSISENPTVVLEFEFYVKAFSDAHILLADTNTMEDMSAYEIVIGGGKNSFSQIRLFPKEAKATQATKNILSPMIYRGFWIKIRPLGLIMVGKIGETDPIVFWINSKPFPIRYISFTTWTNVIGSWYFSCTKKAASEPVEGNVSTIRQLKTDLLTFYNPSHIPQKDEDHYQTVDIHLEASYFYLNEKEGQLTLNGIAKLKWMDWKLRWNASDYDGINVMYATPFQVWIPNVHIINSLDVEKKPLLTFYGPVLVSSKGEVSWTVPFHSLTLCILGYKNWPFDVHNCSLVIGFWTEPLKINVKDMVVSKIFKSEWEIQKTGERGLTISHVDDQVSVIDISFCRRDPTYEFLLLPPFLGAVMLSFISFWLYPNNSLKLFLNCGSILVMILILMSLGDRIPTITSSSPKIVLLYSWSVLVECVPIVLFIVVKYVPEYVIFPRFMSTVLNSNLVGMLFFLPNSEGQSSYSHLREQEERRISALRLITFIERFVFLIYFTILIVPFFLFLLRFDRYLNF